MVCFTAPIEQFREKEEKTGWRYLAVPAAMAGRLKPGNKKSFRVRGTLDGHPIEKKSLLPMGEGIFILPVSAAIRRQLQKQVGDVVTVQLVADDREIEVPADFAACLADEPAALSWFHQLSDSQRNYFIKWIEAARTIGTRNKRMAQAIDGLAGKLDYGQTIRAGQAADPENS